MSNFINETVVRENAEFYPTPKSLLKTMFDKYVEHCKTEKEMTWEFRRVDVLEPSAGKGDILEYFKENVADSYCPAPDCIEKDENLRLILRGKADNLNLIWNDFLTFQTEKHYDLIVMNPPFSNGVKHLLHAIHLAEANGGDTIIMCLLNAETLLNPYTNERKELSKRLSELHAEVQIIEDGFTEAERPTDVKTAFVFIDIPKSFHVSLLLDKLEKAKEYKESFSQPTEIVTAENYIAQMIAFYNREVELCSAFMHEYFSIAPFLKMTLPEQFEPSEEHYQELKEEAGHIAKYDYQNEPILKLTVGKSEIERYGDINKVLNAIRYKYWNHLFHNEEFTKLLTTDMRQELYNTVSSMKKYDFNEHNIKVVQEQFINSLLENLEETILKLFDELTCKHTYYDGSNNIHYYNGWKSNKAHKLNKKVVIPMHGVFDDWEFHSDFFRCYELEHKISDIEKVFNYLSDGTTDGVSVENVIYWANKQQKNRNLHFKYFDASIFKKGTCHLKFTDEAVVDALNIYVGKHKNWLPPSYGKVAYDDMSAEEQAVIDDFQGREEYEKVLANPEKYLFETTSMLALPESTN